MSIREDCPICGGKNTVSITNVDGTVFAHCFRASCTRPTRVLKGRIIPKHTFTPKYYDGDKGWLHNNHMYRENGVRHIHNGLYIPLYNVSRKQVGELVVKHHLMKKITKKYPWVEDSILYYPLTNGGDYQRVIVVEDALSAIHVSAVCNAVSLLTGGLSSRMLTKILAETKAKRISLMLDTDAIGAAVNIIKKFNGIVDLDILQIPRNNPRDVPLEILRDIIQRG